MKIEKVKKRIEEDLKYVAAYENYHPENMKEEAIKLYAKLGNVSTVAKMLNEKGFRKEGKLVAGKRAQVKLISNDITEMINGEIRDGDQLHPIVKNALKRNRRRQGIMV